MRFERELLKGAAPLAVLQVLSRGAMYGYELSQALEKTSGGIITLGHGTLYPLLYNLEAKGLVGGEWEAASSGRQRRYYRITAEGEKHLSAKRMEWARLRDAMDLVLGCVAVGA